MPGAAAATAALGVGPHLGRPPARRRRRGDPGRGGPGGPRGARAGGAGRLAGGRAGGGGGRAPAEGAAAWRRQAAPGRAPRAPRPAVFPGKARVLGSAASRSRRRRSWGTQARAPARGGSERPPAAAARPGSAPARRAGGPGARLRSRALAGWALAAAAPRPPPGCQRGWDRAAAPAPDLGLLCVDPGGSTATWARRCLGEQRRPRSRPALLCACIERRGPALSGRGPAGALGETCGRRSQHVNPGCSNAAGSAEIT